MRANIGDDNDRREFKRCPLSNGLDCIFIQDPSLAKVQIDFVIDHDVTELTDSFISVDEFAMQLCTRGSRRYPGVHNFRKFAEANEIGFEIHSAMNEQGIYAKVSESVLGEYLDRIADMMSSPEIGKESIDNTILFFEESFYLRLISDKFRLTQIRNLHVFNMYARVLTLCKRRDLQWFVQKFIDHLHCPSRMMLMMAANLLFDVMQQVAVEKLGTIPRCSRRIPQFCRLRPLPPLERETLTLVRSHTRSEESMLAADFFLPQEISISSALVVAYLLNTSQDGCLKSRLKSLGQVNDYHADYLNLSSHARALVVEVSPTAQGTENPIKPLSLLLGYIDVIKQMEFTEELFQKAREFFAHIRKNESYCTKFLRMRDELRTGASVDKLRFAGIPWKFDAAEVKLCAESLVSSRCLAVAIANRYLEAPLNIESDYYLRSSSNNLPVKPNSDGLKAPEP